MHNKMLSFFRTLIVIVVITVLILTSACIKIVSETPTSTTTPATQTSSTSILISSTTLATTTFIPSNTTNSGIRELVFTSNGNLYVMQADGSNRTLIPNYYDASYSIPDFTRNGSSMVFVQNGDLFTMNMDGSNKTKVTNHGSGCSDPTWSPDGSRIAFLLNLQPYVINADGSNEHVVAAGITSLLLYGELTWSPDDSKIAFVTPWGTNDNLSRLTDICVANSNGSGYTIVSPHNGSYDDFSWSPDGSIIVFGSGNHIYSVFPDGSNLKTITTGIPVADIRGLAISPSGSLITFIADYEGPTGNNYVGGDNIFVLDIKGTYEKQITQDMEVTTKNGIASGFFRADWSPDGKKIIGLSGHNDDGSTDVNLMDPDGSNLIQLCNVICDNIFIIY